MKTRVGKNLYHDERGVSGLLISTIMLAILFIAAAGGFVWAFMQYTDWKSNGQAKIDVAVEEAKEEQKTADDAAYAEEQKKPYVTYSGKSDLGSVKFSYPKTWAAYQTTEASSNDKLEVYFYPTLVPQIKDGTTPYALRLKVVSNDYDAVLKSYDSLVKNGEATANTLTLERKNGETVTATYEGVRIDGQLTKTINGSVAIFKVRDKTLELFCDSSDWIEDFNNVILATLSFTP